MGIHVGSQNAHSINNVDGTQYNFGGDYRGDPRQLVEELRVQLERLALRSDVQTAASGQVAEMAAALSRPKPDKAAVADRLERVTKLLSSAGVLVAAGTGLGAPLAALAGWLGALGEPITRLLRR